MNPVSTLAHQGFLNGSNVIFITRARGGGKNSGREICCNSSTKSGGQKHSLYAAMQSLYKKDKVFALQYIATEGGSKITYRGSLDEKQRSQAAIKQKRPKMVCDIKIGPPDKCQHFDGNSLPSSKRTKIDEDGCEKREVEVLYADGLWHWGWLSSYNFETGK